MADGALPFKQPLAEHGIACRLNWRLSERARNASDGENVSQDLSSMPQRFALSAVPYN
jgi:hypothetical protein